MAWQHDGPNYVNAQAYLIQSLHYELHLPCVAQILRDHNEERERVIYANMKSLSIILHFMRYTNLLIYNAVISGVTWGQQLFDF